LKIYKKNFCEREKEYSKPNPVTTIAPRSAIKPFLRNVAIRPPTRFYKIMINFISFFFSEKSPTRPSRTIVSNPKYCNCRAAIIPAIPAPIIITRG